MNIKKSLIALALPFALTAGLFVSTTEQASAKVDKKAMLGNYSPVKPKMSKGILTVGGTKYFKDIQNKNKINKSYQSRNITFVMPKGKKKTVKDSQTQAQVQKILDTVPKVIKSQDDISYINRSKYFKAQPRSAFTRTTTMKVTAQSPRVVIVSVLVKYSKLQNARYGSDIYAYKFDRKTGKVLSATKKISYKKSPKL